MPSIAHPSTRYDAMAAAPAFTTGGASQRLDVDHMANDTIAGLVRRLLGLKLCFESGDARRLVLEDGIPLKRLVADRELDDIPSLD